MVNLNLVEARCEDRVPVDSLVAGLGFICGRIFVV